MDDGGMSGEQAVSGNLIAKPRMEGNLSYNRPWIEGPSLDRDYILRLLS
jgi:hypothetical protein